MDKDELHQCLSKTYVSTATMRALIHALIELGVVQDISCQWPECRQATKSFDGHGRNSPQSLSIDHIVPKRLGGTDQPSNLRIVHRGCNNSWRTGMVHGPEWKSKASETHKELAKIIMTCDVCGRECKGPMGYGTHRRKKHGIVTDPKRLPRNAAPTEKAKLRQGEES